jgi:hypothetical protein
LAFLQATEASGLDRGEVYEYIFTVLAADKSKTLRVVKPLYSSLFHDGTGVPFVEIALTLKGELMRQDLQVQRTASRPAYNSGSFIVPKCQAEMKGFAGPGIFRP